MAREYSYAVGGLTAGNITMLGIFANTAPSSNFEILRMWLSQSGALASTNQRVQAVWQTAGAPTTIAGSLVPTPHKFNDTASKLTAAGAAVLTQGKIGVQASAEGAGTKTVILEDSFNVLNGWLWVPGPKETIVIPAGFGGTFGIFLPAAPANTAGWTVGITFAEIG